MFPNALWEYYMSIEKIGTSEYWNLGKINFFGIHTHDGY